jgi:site-specific recombinase XerD
METRPKELGAMTPAYAVSLERGAAGIVAAARIVIPPIDAYLGYLALVGRAATTWSSYAYDLAVFCRWLAARQPDHSIVDALRGLTGGQVFAFVEDELRPSDGRRALAVGSVYRRVVALAKFFDRAVAAGLVDHNPVPRD